MRFKGLYKASNIVSGIITLLLILFYAIANSIRSGVDGILVFLLFTIAIFWISMRCWKIGKEKPYLGLIIATLPITVLPIWYYLAVQFEIII